MAYRWVGEDTTNDRDRLTLRARLNVGAKISEDTSAGLRVTTGTTSGPTSSSQTLGQGFNKSSIVLDRAFVRYRVVARVAAAPWLRDRSSMMLVSAPLFAAVILGGIGSVWGAVLGGLIVGVAESLATGIVDPLVGGGTRDIVASVIILVTLLLTSFGFSATLSILSAIAAKTNNGSMVMAILSFPIIIGMVGGVVMIRSITNGLARWSERPLDVPGVDSGADDLVVVERHAVRPDRSGLRLGHVVEQRRQPHEQLRRGLAHHRDGVGQHVLVPVDRVLLQAHGGQLGQLHPAGA